MPKTILARLQNEPVFIEANAMNLIENCIAQLVASPDLEAVMATQMDTFWPEEGSSMSRVRPYNVANGVLTIPVQGALLNNFPYAWGSYATGYEYILKAVERGMADPDVKGIALNIDSPGGMVSGNFDLVDKIYGMRGQKPIHAFANDSAYSAAYSIASVADHITVNRSGGVGSIGVVTMHVDVSKAFDEAGYKITFIYAGKHKVEGNPYEPLPSAAKARIQKRIDALYTEFVAIVARNRGLEDQAVRDTEAMTFTATESLSNKLADAIGSLDDGLSAFAEKLNLKKGEMTMSTKEKDTAAVDQAQIDQARAEGKAEGVKEGASAEQTRIKGIMALDVSKTRRESAINIALNSQLSVDQAAELLATLPEADAAKAPATASKTPFEAAMDKGNPDLGAGEGDKPEASAADAIIADYNAHRGVKN